MAESPQKKPKQEELSSTENGEAVPVIASLVSPVASHASAETPGNSTAACPTPVEPGAAAAEDLAKGGAVALSREREAAANDALAQSVDTPKKAAARGGGGGGGAAEGSASKSWESLRAAAYSVDKEGKRTLAHHLEPFMCELNACEHSELLDGVLAACVAQRQPQHWAKVPALDWLNACSAARGSCMALTLLQAAMPEDCAVAALVRRALVVAVIRHWSRAGKPERADARELWPLLRDTLDPELGLPVTPSRSAQGFAAFKLFARNTVEGQLGELLRLHVWLPDDMEAVDPDLAIHAHQPFAASFILCGGIENTDYVVADVSAASTSEAAAGSLEMAKYAVRWDDSSEYKVHQTTSIIQNTGERVTIRPKAPTRLGPGTTYSVAAGAFHSSKLSSKRLAATFFYFDSSRGFVQDAPVLGPVAGTSFATLRAQGFGGDPVASGWKLLHQVQQSVRWDSCIAKGEDFVKKSQLEPAKQAFFEAHQVAGSDAERDFALIKQVSVLWRIGDPQGEAAAIAEKVLAGKSISDDDRVELLGELGVIYRHGSQLEKAERTISEQCELSKRIGNQKGLCRALGNLGMVYLQLGQREKGVEMLEQRVSMARELGHALWEAIGLSRLSIAAYDDAKYDEALERSREALAVAERGQDSKAIALGKLFVARPLIRMGRIPEALEQLDSQCGPKRTTAAMALCEEPSTEHARYLREIVDAGCNVLLGDAHGYNCLDFALYAGEEGRASLDIIREALSAQLQKKNAREGLLGCSAESVEEWANNAGLKRGYRLLLQDYLHDVKEPSDVRAAYAKALQSNPDLAAIFDDMKALPLTKFRSHGKIPRSDEGVTVKVAEDDSVDHVIFISYRWRQTLRQTAGDKPNPDDELKTQFRRMVSSVETLVKQQRWDANKVGLWVDFGCIEQDDRVQQQRGVNSLAAVIRQVDAVISLVDEEYYTRAWCSVEIAFAQRLRSRNHVPHWFLETSLTSSRGQGDLSEADYSSVVVHHPELEPGDPSTLNISFEKDRPSVRFLFLQASLL